MLEHIIPEFPEYKINEYGEVFSRYKYKTSIVTDEWRPVQQVLDKGVGYYLVTLVNATTGVKKNRFIHRLLGQLFIDNPLGKPVINHIDGNKQNNALSNLEWCSHRENAIHAVQTGLTTYDHIRVSVSQYTQDGLLIATYKSAVDAQQVTNVARQNISKVLRGLRKTAGGYIWKYTQSSETKESNYTL